MPRRIATWIRDRDAEYFARSFAFYPEALLVNAKKEVVDIEAVDALLLTGGADIGQEFLKQTVADSNVLGKADGPRDRWEFSVVRRAFERDIPVLGICRGHQVLNVALGGTLILDLPGHFEADQRDHEVQPLRYEPGVPATRMFEKVNSSHHQALDRLPEGMVVEARHAIDGVIEQVSRPKARYFIGVQYHPERGAVYSPLFRSFVEAIAPHTVPL